VQVVLLGLPGAGKGTQAALLAERLGVPHIATGDMFRAAVAADSPLGKRVQAIMESGAYVPDGLTIEVMRERLGQPDCAAGAVLDGFPRTVAQADALDGMLADRGRGVDAALLLEVAEDAVIARLALRRVCPRCKATYHLETAPPGPGGRCTRCGTPVVVRADDREDVQRRRLATYRRETEQLLPHYAARGLLVRVDGAGAVAEVAARVAKAVGAA
jgi:adenylate kinase